MESGTVAELKSSLKESDKIDMICLDLTMDGSLEIAEKLRSDYASSYITLIADDKISPVKYIRPSIRAESLMIKPLSSKQIDEVMKEAVVSYMKRLEAPEDRRVFVAESKGNRNLISYDRILFFESREKKVFLSTEMEEYGFYDTLDELEKKMDDTFMRCHRSYIVNKTKIKTVELSAGRVILDDGTEIPLSRSYKKEIKEYLNTGK
ncbi:MAG: LytTR family transcriptional regulator DNA-binding domain-containing protein [Mogibacterium sp.]|nr:LytTR family transcriptional regulator DNA-binding domain-containing protein [Mogibacterium sp.]